MNGSLRFAKTYVADAFVRVPEKPFQPENTAFGAFTFVPWVRQGLAAALQPPADGQLRATVRAEFAIADDAGGRVPVPAQTLTLRGPGDVVALERAQIVRRYPAPGAADAEENLLAHVEFDRPELPWLFSPLAPEGERLAPWLALVVCEAAVSQIMPGAPGFPSQLRTRLGELQPLDDAWAWAHAQVIGPVAGGPSVADRLSDAYGPTNLSRLLCPRRLAPRTAYVAAVVPAFECGMKVGLGSSGGTLEPAWRRRTDNGDAEQTIVLPVFDTWEFSTAPAGDFEQLAKRLQGLPAPWNVGRRIIDCSQPRGGLPSLAENADGRLQVLRCALVSPTPVPPDQPSEAETWNAVTRDRLRTEVDRSNVEDETLPRVGARLYARYQRGETTLGPLFGQPPAPTPAVDGDWFTQLNTSPLHRLVAGLGTRVVQQDQEPLMQAAWLQLGELRKTNDALVRIQFGRFVSEAMHRKHLGQLALGELTQVLRGVHDKVRAPQASLTVRGVAGKSTVAPAALTGAFRRAARVRGPLSRVAAGTGTAALRQMVARDEAFQDFRRPYAEPEGVRTLSAGAIASFSPALVARKLQVPEAQATAALAQRLNARSRFSVTDRFSRPFSSGELPTGTIDLRERAATQLLDHVAEAMPAQFPDAPARAEALAPLLVAVADSGAPQAAERASVLVDQVAVRVQVTRVAISTAAASTAPAVAATPPSAAAAASTIAGARVSEASATRVTPADSIRGEPRVRPVTDRVNVDTGIATPAVPVISPASRLRFESEASRQISRRLTEQRPVALRDVASAVAQVVVETGLSALPRTPDRPPLVLSRQDLLTAVAPATTVTSYARQRLRVLPEWLPSDWFDDHRISPIMAAPRFSRAMFAALDDYSRDWLIPGVGSIEPTDFVTVLETNPAFTETFLIGLSDEMGRELRWRGFPTDLRGTYFHRFWNPLGDDLGHEIHRFAQTPLGSHVTASAQKRVVLVVRGEIVRRYPDAIFVALRAGATDAKGRPVFAAPESDASATAPVLFHHVLDPDLLLVGFDLSPDQVRQEPWWFIIAENPSAPRFGLDLFEPTANAAAASGVQRDRLDWNDLGPLVHDRFLSALQRTLVVKDPASQPVETTWPSHAGVVARTLLQSPVRAAFIARKLIAPALPE